MSFSTSKVILDKNMKNQNKTITYQNDSSNKSTASSLGESPSKSVRTRHKLMNMIKRTFNFKNSTDLKNLEKNKNNSSNNSNNLFSIKNKKSGSPKTATKKSTPLKKTNSNKSIYSTTTASTNAETNSMCTTSSLDRESLSTEKNSCTFSLVSSMDMQNRVSKASKSSKMTVQSVVTSSSKGSDFARYCNQDVPRVKLPVFLRQSGELLGISTKNTRVHDNADLIPIATKADLKIKVNDVTVCNSHSISQNFITKDLQNLQLVKKTRAEYQNTGCISDGQGSYGDVFTMKNVKTNEKVAVKAISLRRNQPTRHNSQGFNEGILEEVKLESDILAQFKNAPGVTQFLGSCVLDNQTVKNVNKRNPEHRERAEMAYIFMEHGGTDLFRVLQQNDLSYFECLRIARGIVVGLNSLQNHVNGKKFIHADLKPGNILVNLDVLKSKSEFSSLEEMKKHDEKLVSLIDLLSCEAIEDNSNDAILKKDLCVTTPGYVAPEIVAKQCSREPRLFSTDTYAEEDKLDYSTKSDCFAVGTLLTELVRGKVFLSVQHIAGRYFKHEREMARVSNDFLDDFYAHFYDESGKNFDCESFLNGQFDYLMEHYMRRMLSDGKSPQYGKYLIRDVRSEFYTDVNLRAQWTPLLIVAGGLMRENPDDRYSAEMALDLLNGFLEGEICKDCDMSSAMSM